MYLFRMNPSAGAGFARPDLVSKGPSKIHITVREGKIEKFIVPYPGGKPFRPLYSVPSPFAQHHALNRLHAVMGMTFSTTPSTCIFPKHSLSCKLFCCITL
jgi:hypothetical protein